MSTLPSWAQCSIIAALVLLSPALAFLMVIAAEMLIDFAMEVGAAAVCVVAAGAIGWVLYRKRSPHPEVTPQWEPEEEPDEGAIAVPPG
jgi:hypothetical protein